MSEAAVVTNALLDYYSQHRAASGGMRVVDDDEAPFVNAEADVAAGLPSCNITAFEPAYPGVYVNMLAEADMWMGKLRAMLKTRGMWDSTLLVYASECLKCEEPAYLVCARL